MSKAVKINRKKRRKGMKPKEEASVIEESKIRE